MVTAITRSARDAVSRLGLADAAFWLYGWVARINPKFFVANARYRRLGAPDGLPIPPPDLIFLVAGTSDISWFLKGGELAASSISEALRAAGVNVAELGAILDFGCGCGRVLRNWHSLPHSRANGTDYNAKLIAWSRVNLPFAQFQINQLSPPLAYADAEFDLVYALSVFTHLTEDLQGSWMTELTRVIKPGGHLIISAHGECYLHRLNVDERRRFESGQIVVKNNVKSPGSNTCSAYHPFAYVRDQLAIGLEVVQFTPNGAKGNPQQDLYVLLKPRHAT
jgi:SAM-dependent methyltransferase